MGNLLNSPAALYPQSFKKFPIKNKCFICLNSIIENTYVKCVLCDMSSHHNCYTNNSYCHQCHKTGTLCNYTSGSSSIETSAT